MTQPDFTVITPCLNPGRSLWCCCASVADQQGVTVEHIVVDGASSDGTVDWLAGQKDIHWVSEPDGGMYAAINKGLHMANGRYLAYLNSDEQYLPDALCRVAEAFQRCNADVLFCDTVVVDPGGDYLCSRQSLVPWYYHSAFCELGTLTAATFFRQELLDREAAFFDERWKAIGDVDWMLRLLRAGVGMDVLRVYTSVFTDSGDNLALSKRAKEEAAELRQLVSRWSWAGAPVFRVLHRLRRLMAGLYRPAPFSYALYKGDLQDRTVVEVRSPTFLWRSRMGGS